MCLMEPAQILPLPFLCLCAEWNWEKSLTVNITAPKCYDHKPQFPMLYDSKFSRLFSHHSIVISPFFLLPSFCLDNTPQFKTKVTCNKRHGLFCAFLSLVFQGILKKKSKNSKKHLSTILPKYHFPFPILVCLYPIPHQVSLRRH